MKSMLATAFTLTVSLCFHSVSANAADACPVTLGKAEILGAPFPKPLEGRTWYGSESLAVQLRADGVIPTTKPGARIAIKLFLWSAGFEPGMEHNLRVDVSSVNGEPVTAKVDERPTNAYAEDLGGWTMLTGIDFPDPGCWRISAEYLGQTLTFVVETIAVDDYVRRTEKRAAESS